MSRNLFRRVAACSASLLLLAAISVNAHAATILLDFEGLANGEAINDFYNGGLGSLGSGPGVNHGVTFSTNALVSIDSDAGGSGNFGGEPSPDTAMFFLTGVSAIMNVPAGFDTGFSFFYSAIRDPGSVDVFDGIDGTGALLATLTLPTTPNNGAPDPTGTFSPFVPIGVAFAGTARSVSFAGVQNQIGFDNVTFGSANPGGQVPEPTSMAMFACAGIGLIFGRRRNKR
tara:strand:- start:173021 stop:173707 length:687 start_codon:yes stop_codon:yes gene_type:complete